LSMVIRICPCSVVLFIFLEVMSWFSAIMRFLASSSFSSSY
jgi:hypothetical protein